MDPSVTGSQLFSKIEPILNEQFTDGITFLQRVALEISTYITSKDSIQGTYAGTVHSTPSPLIVANAKFIPVSVQFEDPSSFLYDYAGWIKKTLLNTLTWNMTAIPPHSFTPRLLVPVVSKIDLIGDLKNIRTAKGFWALLSDAIIWSIISSTTRITPIAATATDGSSGTITWIPLTLPSFTHNFVFNSIYDSTNLELSSWLQVHRAVINTNTNEAEIVFNNQTYQDIQIVWQELKALTKDCQFYKLQDNNDKILLMSGYDI